jgi:zinc transport system substrate-binding protein
VGQLRVYAQPDNGFSLAMNPPVLVMRLFRAGRRLAGDREERRGRGRKVAALACCGVLGLLPACTERASRDDDRPIVAVSVPPQAYFVERLADDLVRIEVMIPPGASPHTHEPDIAQVRAVGNAVLYVMVGHPSFPFERTWLDRLLVQNHAIRTVDCAQGVTQRQGDPHLWLSPRIVRGFVPRIAAALAEVLPDHREEIARREEELLGEIDRLDADIRASLAGAGKRFYVFHPAWGYFAAEYDLEQVPIEVDNKEPDPRQVAALIRRAREEGARVIFVQPQFSKRSAELIANEVGARVVVVDPLARDWAANLRQVAAAFRQGLS